MNGVLRILGVLVILIPLYLSTACMDVELDDFDGPDVGVDEESDVEVVERRRSLSFDRMVDDIVAAHEETGADVDDDWIDEAVEFSVTERGFGEGDTVVIDPNAPDLEIVQVTRHEADGRHYLDVTCHDATPRLPTRWFSGRLFSRDCAIDLSTVFHSVRVEPQMNYRIAPTPRGFRVLGDFPRGEVEVTFRPGLSTEGGAVLKEDHTHALTIPALSPSLSFEAQGRYLPRWAWEELAFEHRNLEEATLEVRHIPPRNLPFWLSDRSDNVTARTSRRLFREELPLDHETDEVYRRALSVEEILGDPEPGLYQFHVQSGRTHATARLLVTEINLIVKQHEAPAGKPFAEHMDGWAVDMDTNQPLSGVNLRAIRTNGDELARCRTNRQGHCRLDMPTGSTDDAPPMAVIASRGDDLTYLRFQDVRTEVQGATTTGRSFLDEDPYLVTLHGDRDLYRPGDRVHIVGALRDPDFSSAGGGIPVELHVRDSRGQILVEQDLTTDEAGLVEISFPLSDIAPTGRWRAELLVAKDRLQTYTFNVEEFMPERLEASAEALSEHFVGDEETLFEVYARYLFDASAQGSSVEATCRLVPTTVSAPWARGFAVGPSSLDDRREVIDLPSVQAVIGEEDTVEVACPKPSSPLTGPARLDATFAVSEAGSGRATHTSAQAMVYPEDRLVGLRSSEDAIGSGDSFVVEGRIFDVGGELVDVEEEITLEFYNVRTQTSSQWRGGRWHYQHNTQLVLERAVDVQPVDGRFRVETVAADVFSGYLVRARLGDSVTDLRLNRSQRFWRWSARQDATPRALRPTPVTVDVPDEARLNRPTTITFDAPFAGRALLTVETDKVIEQAWLDAEEGKNEWTFTLTDHLPNVYVSAFVIRDGREEVAGGFAPERAYGTAPLRVERTPVETAVRILAPEEVRPGSSLEVQIVAEQARGPSRATVAVVDEGILQLTNYRTPDPLNTLLARRALGVETFDTVGWATQLPAMGPSSRTGGGDYYYEDESADASRILPFRPVAMWSGPVELDDRGMATVSFDVPNYRGRVRVMTAVFTEDRLGSAEADVLVRDPLTVQSTFPRFLIEDDWADVPVFVANLTEETREIEVRVEARPYELPGFDIGLGSDAPVVEFPEGSRQTIELAPGQSRTVNFAVSALASSGAAEMLVHVESGDLRSTDEGMIPLRPEGPRERRVQTVELNGSEVDLNEALSGWVAGSEESTIWLTSLAQPEAFDHLDYLIRYPFGCAEQTTSSARPLLYVSQLVEVLNPQEVAQAGRVSDMVDSGIQRLLNMQSANGQFSYWGGGGDYSTWVTAYALHFLLDARQLGFEVPQSRIDSAVSALKNGVNDQLTHAYAHYVLAVAGEPQRGQVAAAIDRLPSNPTGQNAEQAYLLYAALYLSGDRSYERELRNPVVDRETGGRESGWGFYSHQRRRAMVFNVFVDLFGYDRGGAEMAQSVASQLAGGSRFTTQEVVWSVTGLGKWLQQEFAINGEFTLASAGQPVESTRGFMGLPAWTLPRASERNLTLTANVDTDRPVFAVVSSSGVRQDRSYEYGGAGVRVQREYLNERGQPLDFSDVQLGQRVFVRVRIENRTYSTLRQIALTDRLPAGLETELVELGSSELPAWAQSSWNFDHTDRRDDRVDVFGTINRRQTVEIYHVARATMSGNFRVPSVEVEAMYDPDVWAREKGRVLRITNPRREL